MEEMTWVDWNSYYKHRVSGLFGLVDLFSRLMGNMRYEWMFKLIVILDVR